MRVNTLVFDCYTDDCCIPEAEMGEASDTSCHMVRFLKLLWKCHFSEFIEIQYFFLLQFYE